MTSEKKNTEAWIRGDVAKMLREPAPPRIERVFEYKVIYRGHGEFVPVVTVEGVEIFRGSVYHDAGSAFDAALTSRQAHAVRNGADPREVAR